MKRNSGIRSGMRDVFVTLVGPTNLELESNYYESPPGEPDVDKAFGKELDDPATRALADHTFKHIARGEASRDDGEEIASIIAASFGTKTPTVDILISGPEHDTAESLPPPKKGPNWKMVMKYLGRVLR